MLRPMNPAESLPDRLRAACAELARRARFVSIETGAIPAYARSLPEPPALSSAALSPPERRPTDSGRERVAAFWLTLDAINFGSGWFPTLRKRGGRSGYGTISTALRERCRRFGPWSARELAAIERAELAAVLDQDPEHELIGLFVGSLRCLGERLAAEHGGCFSGPLDAAGGEALALVHELSGWECFSDVSRYQELELPFLKRAQIAAADLHRAGAACFRDLDRLTMFADNLVPHVLRCDGLLHFDPGLVERIEAGELIVHGSEEEVEIRACAVHAVELIVASRPGTCAAAVDQLLWERGAQPRYKARPRHRCRCTAY
jgi:hypothetical protein